MDIRQLEIFVAVVENLSFSKAAQKIYLTQPTISAHIASLEKELAVPLLIRNTRELYPSEAGQKLYEYAVKILRLREEALAEVGNKNNNERGVINIAASTIPSKHLLPALIAGFRKDHPAISFQIIHCDSGDICRVLSNQQAHIGFGGAVINSEYCSYQAIADDKLVIITPDNEHFSRLAGDSSAFTKLMQEPFILRSIGSGTRYEFEQYLLRHNHHLPLTIVAEMTDTEAIKNSVTAGMGISVISDLAAADGAKFGQLRVFPLPDGGDRQLYLIKRKKSHLNEIERKFYAYVLEKSKKS